MWLWLQTTTLLGLNRKWGTLDFYQPRFPVIFKTVFFLQIFSIQNRFFSKSNVIFGFICRCKFHGPFFVFESCCQRILFLDNYTIDLSPTASNRGATKGLRYSLWQLLFEEELQPSDFANVFFFRVTMTCPYLSLQLPFQETGQPKTVKEMSRQKVP